MELGNLLYILICFFVPAIYLPTTDFIGIGDADLRINFVSPVLCLRLACAPETLNEINQKSALPFCCRTVKIEILETNYHTVTTVTVSSIQSVYQFLVLIKVPGIVV